VNSPKFISRLLHSTGPIGLVMAASPRKTAREDHYMLRC
jgi:hypothetical protein